MKFKEEIMNVLVLSRLQGLGARLPLILEIALQKIPSFLFNIVHFCHLSPTTLTARCD